MSFFIFYSKKNYCFNTLKIVLLIYSVSYVIQTILITSIMLFQRGVYIERKRKNINREIFT